MIVFLKENKNFISRNFVNHLDISRTRCSGRVPPGGGPHGWPGKAIGIFWNVAEEGGILGRSVQASPMARAQMDGKNTPVAQLFLL